MKREQATPYISLCIDDALGERSIDDMPANARLVGWQCGFEPMFVAVWSYQDRSVRVSDLSAECVAVKILEARRWFSGEPTPADYII